MRQIIEVLRLKYEAGLSHERIARACGLSKGMVGKYVSLARLMTSPGRCQRMWMRCVWKRCCSRPRPHPHALPNLITFRSIRN